MTLQVFIHRHDKTINLILSLIIAGVAFFILYNQAQTAHDTSINQANEAIAREEAVASLLEADQQVIQDIKDNQEKQTKLIICLLAAHGANVIITPEDEEECRILVDEAVEQGEEHQYEFEPQAEPPKE